MAVDPLQETTFTFMGETFSVRPNFRLIARIESATNQGGRQLAQKISEGSISLTEQAAIMACIVMECDALKKSKPDEIGEALMEEGTREVSMPMLLLLARANKGNKEHEKEAALKNPPQGVEATQGQD